MVRHVLFAAVVGLALLSSPANARSSQPIADWSKVEQEVTVPPDGADFVNCPSFLKASGTFSQGCLVGVPTTANPNRAVNILGWYDRNGIPRANPDPRVEALPRLYNLTPTVAPAVVVPQAKLKAGDTFPVRCSGQPATATFSRSESSTGRFTAIVPSDVVGSPNVLVRWEADGTPVGRNHCILQ